MEHARHERLHAEGDECLREHGSNDGETFRGWAGESEESRRGIAFVCCSLLFRLSSPFSVPVLSSTLRSSRLLLLPVFLFPIRRRDMLRYLRASRPATGRRRCPPRQRADF